jgi:UPF0755 protein
VSDRITARTLTRALVVVLLAASAAACSGAGRGPARRVRIPAGASFTQVTDSLARYDVVRFPSAFAFFARMIGADDEVKAGTYGFRTHMGWHRVLEDLRLGRVLTVRLVIPEGWDLRAIANRIAAITGAPSDSVLNILLDTATVRRYGVPGPSLEGYLFPATYTFPIDVPVTTILDRLVREYRAVWTPERTARADSIGLSEREIVALASIVEKEARQRAEMPLIAAVYHNRLRIGIPLQADPTVQYALGEHQARLLRAHIDSVADDPYNTYTHPGLPPGPIASPSAAGIDAVLHPADADYLYFVARPDGTHIFSRSLDEHNRARVIARRLWEQAGRYTPRRDRPAAN